MSTRAGQRRSAVTSPWRRRRRDALETAALADEKVQAFLNGATPKKVIVIAGPAGQPVVLERFRRDGLRSARNDHAKSLWREGHRRSG